tara:strand:+ start:2663 stop:2983 length:321 start_codon:yes stop_codon:yes gene_type:complete
MRLKALVNRIFIEARSIVGRLGIRTIWKGGDVGAGKYYVRHLMKDAGLICKKSEDCTSTSTNKPLLRALKFLAGSTLSLRWLLQTRIDAVTLFTSGWGSARCTWQS